MGNTVMDILKGIAIALLCIVGPVLLLVVALATIATVPIVGLIVFVLLPGVVIGLIIGRKRQNR